MHPLYARVRLHGHYYGQTTLVGTYLSIEWKKILAGLVPGPAWTGVRSSTLWLMHGDRSDIAHYGREGDEFVNIMIC